MKSADFKNFIVKGKSIAGEETSLALPKWDLLFDIGKCPFQFVHYPYLFLTHGHPDHSGGIIHFLFQKKVKNLPTPTIYAPKSLISPLQHITKMFSAIHDTYYPADFVGLEPGMKVELERVDVEVLKAVHTIDAHAYVIREKRPPFNPLFAYTGDTSIEIFDLNPILYQVPVLFVECTYMSTTPIEKARVYQHIHFDQLLANAEHFANQHLVLTHLSPRYKSEQIQHMIDTVKHRISPKLSFF